MTAVAGIGLGCWAIFSVGSPADALPPFELANWDGRRVSMRSLQGRRVVLAFTYAKCVYSCPLITYRLKELDEELGHPPDLAYLHISVNPAADTAEEILQHFAKHDIDPRLDPRWLFLGGEEAAVAAVLRAFGIEVKRTPVDGGIHVEHTIKVLVIDPAGRAVATFHTYHWDDERMRGALRS